ncbi:putative cytokinetic ring protein SteA [Haloechinothrix sp. LS1_15]|uniref:putative cytokinetic ring protein SteA n=1 Tax=Haloechinothrix sp. LS1_15 TaxID=2652248 RepID=UPI002945F81C|nr:putative cytokinetic ring protein SteA [Haloechinothrix sp. LS1_15]MDV6013435.1 thiamine pyrophosphokinase [Haloechinothrix sp. LS1_15]
MKLSGVLSRKADSLPGVIGVARVNRRTRELLRRVGAGDIAVIDQVDLDRATANALVKAGVAGVVNASPSISGRFPNLGPEILVGAGIPLIDAAGAEVLHAIKDGSKIRLDEGVIYQGERELAQGIVQTPESVADAMIEAKAGMTSQLEAFSANTMEFLRRERTLVLDGVGVPDLRVPLQDKHVVVVAPGTEHAQDLKRLKKYIAEYHPVLIGVDMGADTLHEQGYTPHVIVGDPTGIASDTLKGAGEVVVPAQPDGYAPGVERIQDLGIGAVTFPSSANPEDLALLLADAHGAALVVTVGFQATLQEFLDQGRSGSNPSTFLTRLKLGTKLVDAKAVSTVYRGRVSVPAVLFLVVAALVAVMAALAVSGVGDVYLDWLYSQLQGLLDWARRLVS